MTIDKSEFYLVTVKLIALNNKNIDKWKKLLKFQDGC